MTPTTNPTPQTGAESVMNETKFAKIVEIDGEQVLFYLEPDHDADDDIREKLHQICRVDGVCADVCLGGMTSVNADKAFASIDEQMARNVIKIVRDMMLGESGSQ